MKISVYRNMTLNIFHSINIIKQIKEQPPIENHQYIDFKFKKPGFKKLIIFDLDETLIHCQKEEEDYGIEIDEDEEDEDEDEANIDNNSSSQSSLSSKVQSSGNRNKNKED